MYRMALLAFMIPANDQIDRSKIIKMALIHDVAEAKVDEWRNKMFHGEKINST